MSGIETVKIIVDAEKGAGQMLEKAHAKATEIRKELDSRIMEEREQILKAARKEAAAIVQRAEEEVKLEAESYAKESNQRTKQLVTKASAKKNAAVDKLVKIVLEGKV
jgi:vacuolar-type H+-ATPase subunit H